jgi:hypothetical protein
MVDVGFSHALEDCPQTQAQEKCLYFESHASKDLSSALSAKVEGMIEIEYNLLKSANLIWKALEQIYGSSNDKRSSSTNILKNASSSSMHIDQDHEEQSSIQNESVKSASMGKSDEPVSQTGVSSFGRTETKLVEEDDYSTSSSDDDDDDNTDNENDDQVLLEAFQKLISKHMNCKRNMEISYVLMQSSLTHMHC